MTHPPTAATADVESVDVNGSGMVHSASFGDLDMASDGVRVTVKDLTYRVPSFKDKKEMAKLLSDVSGIFNPGEMTALLVGAWGGPAVL